MLCKGCGDIINSDDTAELCAECDVLQTLYDEIITESGSEDLRLKELNADALADVQEAIEEYIKQGSYEDSGYGY